MVFIKYCVFSKILKYIPDSGLSLLPLGVRVCTQWQVKHQRCSRTCRVQKNHNILRKKRIFNGHPVDEVNILQILAWDSTYRFYRSTRILNIVHCSNTKSKLTCLNFPSIPFPSICSKANIDVYWVDMCISSKSYIHLQTIFFSFFNGAPRNTTICNVKFMSVETCLNASTLLKLIKLHYQHHYHW